MNSDEEISGIRLSKFRRELRHKPHSQYQVRKGIKWPTMKRPYYCPLCEDYYTNKDDAWYILNFKECFYCHFPQFIKRGTIGIYREKTKTS